MGDVDASYTYDDELGYGVETAQSFLFGAVLNDGVSGSVVMQVPAGIFTNGDGNANTASNQLRFRGSDWTVSIEDATATRGSDETIDFEVTLSGRDDCTTATVDWEVTSGTAAEANSETTASGTLTFAPGETTQTASIPLSLESKSTNVERLVLRVYRQTDTGERRSSDYGTGAILPVEDTNPPTATVTSTVEAPVFGGFMVKVEFSEPITGFEVSDLEVVNGIALRQIVRSDGMSYSVRIIPDPDPRGDLSVKVPAGVVTDLLGNANTVSTPFVVATVLNPGRESSGVAVFSPAPRLACSDRFGGGLRSSGVLSRYDVLVEMHPGDDLPAFNPDNEPHTGSIAVMHDGVDVATFIGGGADWTHTGIIPYFGAIVGEDVTGTVSVQVLAGAARDSMGRPTAASNTLHIAHNWTVSISDASATEGADETVDFEVRLNSRDDCRTVTVDWTTADGTATAGEDYTEASGTLTFAPGEWTKTVSITLLDDATHEGLDTLGLRLSNAVVEQFGYWQTDITIADDEATAEITDDDPEQMNNVLARFKNVPDSHDGSTRFTFEVHFSEDIEGLSFRTVRDSMFEVDGATVTGARRLTQGRNEGWQVTVEPSSAADIAISLPARACGETGAVCTADNRALPGAISVTVPAEQQSAQQSAASLSARFANMPDSHIGLGVFEFEIHFSEEPHGLSYKTVRDALFDVVNGRVTTAKRLTPGSNLAFAVTVEPTAQDAIEISVRETESCEAEHAVCASDGRMLPAGPSVTVQYSRPITLSVADAEVEEGPGAKLDFVVSLSRAADNDITVWYRAYDGTATAGADYEAVQSSFVFSPGETQRTVSVVVLDDALDEGPETVKFWIGGVRGLSVQQVVDSYATGTIHNTDKMPKAWIARFGRTVADHVLDAVQARRESVPTPGMEASLAGHRIGGATLPDDAFGHQDWNRGRSLSTWLAGGTSPQRHNLDSRTVTDRDLRTGSSFSLTAQTKGSGLISIWGRGAVTRFDGQEGDLTVDGAVASAMLGADWTEGDWKTGLLLSHSLGDGGYQGASAGTVSSTLTGIFPWARHALSERLSVWGVAGYGEGSLTLEPEEQPRIRTDLELWMAAAGLRGVLLDGGNDGPTFAATTDATVVRTSSDAVSGGIGNLAAAEAEVTRLRLGLEGSQPFQLAEGATLTPSVEIGVRQDGGDAETGFGVDIGGGLAWSDTARGISAEFRGRGLLTHEADGLRERGLSGSLSWDPTPASDRGPRASLTQTLGGASSGGMDALLSRETLAGFAANDNGNDLQKRRLEARFGYGFAAFGDRFTSVPEVAMGLSSTGRDYSLGWRLVRGGRSLGGGSLELSVEALRREAANEDIGPEHQIGFRVNARF